MATAAEFNELFDNLVAGPVADVGGWQEGRRLFFQDHLITAAVLRTELRYQPPIRLTLGIRHRFLRGLGEQVPSRPPANPSEYPIKIAPSRAVEITSSGWHYESHNLGRWPADVVPYPDWPTLQISRFLTPIGETLAAVLPQLHLALPAERMLKRLRRDGEDAWCERLWIADLDSAQGSER